ncbi:sulfatase maturation enzyme AslB (radical SAM superfamily) [Oxalobacteraceae bacterium GrIS 2.11]
MGRSRAATAYAQDLGGLTYNWFQKKGMFCPFFCLYCFSNRKVHHIIMFLSKNCLKATFFI